MAKVDILLPFWGDVTLFKATVDSVLKQTETEWKLKIFDDCYPSSEQIQYIEMLNDSRITYHRHDKNIGITSNFNYALSKATAPYFMILGCDDLLKPSYIKTSLSDIEDADFYQPAVEVIDHKGKVYKPLVDRVKSILSLEPGAYSGEMLAVSLCRGNWLYFPSILWRTETLKQYKFEEKYTIAEDLFLELQLTLDGRVLRVGKKAIFQYRRFSHSLSSVEKKRGGVRFNEEKEVYMIFANKFEQVGWKKAARAARLRLVSRAHQLLSYR